jgi:hypothetical protein
LVSDPSTDSLSNTPSVVSALGIGIGNTSVPTATTIIAAGASNSAQNSSSDLNLLGLLALLVLIPCLVYFLLYYRKKVLKGDGEKGMLEWMEKGQGRIDIYKKKENLNVDA